MGIYKMLKLSNGAKVRYKVFSNEQKKKVTAVAYGCEQLGLDACRPILQSVRCVEFESDCLLFRNLHMQACYASVGIAREPDTFDVLMGETVAVAKLSAKLERCIARRKAMLAKELRRMADLLDKSCVIDDSSSGDDVPSNKFGAELLIDFDIDNVSLKKPVCDDIIIDEEITEDKPEPFKKKRGGKKCGCGITHPVFKDVCMCGSVSSAPSDEEVFL